MTEKTTTFDGERAYEHVAHLAATIGPRLTGTAGEHKAARYIARHFRSCGLKVSRQRFPVVTFDNRKCTLEVRRGGTWQAVDAEPTMLAKSTPPAGVEGEVFYAEAGQAEYFTPAVKGKVVLVVGSVPGEARLRLIGFGAKALVAIDPQMRPQHRRSILGDKSRKAYGSLPMASIRHLDGVGLLQDLPDRVRLVLRNTERKSHSLNVVGELPGTDYADEIVVICGHYDSHWQIAGAGDNAGGTAVMMELARVLAAGPSRRTLRFIAFAAEETGLHGSTHYANELARTDRRDRKRAGFDEHADRTECTRHRLTFNLDVHGCVLGQWRATYNGPEDVGASVRLLAKELGMACDVQNKPMSSDGTPLAAVGVPNVQFARYGGTTGFGHGVGDDIRWISAEALHGAGVFSQRYLRRYVTDAPSFAFPREIPDDQMKDVKDYFAKKGRLPIPGAEPPKPPRLRAARGATARKKR